jgi:hypothetical protein
LIESVEVDSIEKLIRKLNEFPNHFVFRGHSDASWKLESTLERIIGPNWSGPNATKFEDHSYQVFQSKYHIYNKNEHMPKSKLAWLAIMQHYGIPTRLLDFTESPYIALYFALESYNPIESKDLSIFCIDYTAIMDASISFIKNIDSQFSETRQTIHCHKDYIFDNIVDRYSYDIIWITEPGELNARMDRQSGTFLISGNRAKKIESILGSELYRKCDMLNIIIKRELYVNAYALLRKMSINAKSIYGDVSGLAKSIKMDLQAYTI